MKALIAVITIFFLGTVSVPAKSQVLQCADGMPPIGDDWLQRSVTKLKLEHPDLTFQSNYNKPCEQAKYTVKAFSRTLGRNYLKNISGYEFVKVNSEGYFTIERFKINRPEDLQAFVAALKNSRSRTLKIESFTSYEYFFSGDNIVIMLSSVTAHAANSKMFLEVQQTFSSLATTTY
jgi:hypothetical protein